MAVVVCATVQAVNDFQKESQFQKLNSVADKQKQVTAIRGGKALTLHHSMVLVGDLIQIYEGMEIPADGYIIEAAEITVDESAMTGETDPIKKNTLSESIKRRDQIVEEGAKATVANHDIFSPVLLSGTRVRK
jgi:P-type E1-E2 ATPase